MKEPSKPTEPSLLPLTEEEWEEMYKRLRLYTYRKFGYLQTQLKTGVDLEGVINDSLEAVLRGDRHRPDGLDIFFFICGVIRSKVNAVSRSAEERRRVCIEGYIEAPPSNDLDSVTYKHSHLGRLQETSDQETYYSEIAHVIRTCVQNDDTVSQYVEELIDTPDQKPGDIARKLNVPIANVRNARKRLKRLVPKIKEALGYE